MRIFKNFETRIGFEESLFRSLLQGVERVENYLGNFKDLKILTIEVILIRIF